MRSHRLLALALIGIAALLSPAGAGAANPLRGRIYDAATAYTDVASVTFALVVSRDGRRVRFSGDGADIGCGGNTSLSLGTTGSPAARLSATGGFSFSVPMVSDISSDPPSHPLRVTGHFSSGSAATGLVDFDQTFPGGSRCRMHARWQGKLRPRFDVFRGGSGAGTRVTFARTVARHPVLTDFSFGTISLRCDDGSRISDSTTSTASIVVRPGPFSALLATNGGEYETVAGRFSTQRAIQGTMSFASRSNCSAPVMHWSVRLVARDVVGPVDFPVHGF